MAQTQTKLQSHPIAQDKFTSEVNDDQAALNSPYSLRKQQILNLASNIKVLLEQLIQIKLQHNLAQQRKEQLEEALREKEERIKDKQQTQAPLSTKNAYALMDLKNQLAALQQQLTENAKVIHYLQARLAQLQQQQQAVRQILQILQPLVNQHNQQIAEIVANPEVQQQINDVCVEYGIDIPNLNGQIIQYFNDPAAHDTVEFIRYFNENFRSDKTAITTSEDDSNDDITILEDVEANVKLETEEHEEDIEAIEQSTQSDLSHADISREDRIVSKASTQPGGSSAVIPSKVISPVPAVTASTESDPLSIQDLLDLMKKFSTDRFKNYVRQRIVQEQPHRKDDLTVVHTAADRIVKTVSERNDFQNIWLVSAQKAPVETSPLTQLFKMLADSKSLELKTINSAVEQTQRQLVLCQSETERLLNKSKDLSLFSNMRAPAPGSSVKLVRNTNGELVLPMQSKQTTPTLTPFKKT